MQVGAFQAIGSYLTRSAGWNISSFQTLPPFGFPEGRLEPIAPESPDEVDNSKN